VLPASDLDPLRLGTWHGRVSGRRSLELLLVIQSQLTVLNRTLLVDGRHGGWALASRRRPASLAGAPPFRVGLADVS
jgi:hypothetical protein